uniref:Serine hydrolase domain-containing protein n=1 Tax=Hemiselmis andersenii TaxID=464988 RepID=A0A7S1MZ59_HEMAN|mmetsp:Transcript_8881/g.21777  ORF Transcript_8881/g.21777 Transcript_8881/m.21777 type:complete len:267 (+) Transcript_8881:48-848(+)
MRVFRRILTTTPVARSSNLIPSFLPLLVPALLAPASPHASPLSTLSRGHLLATASSSSHRPQQRRLATMAAEKEKVRVLALHGYGQTAEGFSSKMGAVRKECKSAVEWVFLDAPFTVSHDSFDMTGQSWYDFSNKDEVTGDRVWGEFDKTLKLFEDTWRDQGPFDGVLGFSQGASVAMVLSALQSRGKAPPGVSFDFVCMISGFPPADPTWRSVCMEEPIKGVRALHVIGEGDTVVEPARSESAVGAFGGGGHVVVTHAKGHLVPS